MTRSALHTLFVVCACLLLHGGPSLAAMELAFSPSAEVTGAKLLLSDIATMTPADNDMAFVLSKPLYVRPPAPGKTVTLARVTLKSYLSHRYPALAEAEWTGAETITVTRASQTIGPETIRSVLEQYLAGHQGRYPDSDLKLVNMQLPESFSLPLGVLDLEVIPSGTDLLQTNRFALLVRVNGKLEKNFSVFAEIEALTPVVTVVHDIQRGQVLSRDDLHLTVVNLARVNQTPVLKMADALGKETKRTIRRGQLLDPSLIDAPTMIKRGEVVLIKAHADGLTVTAKGVALKDGRKDEVIGVKNLGSKKTLLTRVIAPGNVEVRF